MDSRLFTATADEILSDISLYNACTKTLKSCGYRVRCNCGKAQKKENVDNFIINKQNILKIMSEVNQRTIVPLFKGIIYVANAKKHFNANSMSDKAILEAIENGWLSKDRFDFSKYKGQNVSAENTSENTSENTPDISRLDSIVEEMYKEGKSCKEIAQRLNDLGYKTKNGKDHTPVSVSSLVKKFKE